MLAEGAALEVAPATRGGRPPSGRADVAPAAAAPMRRGWLGTRYRPAVLAALCAVVALGAGYLTPLKPKDGVALVVGAALVVAVLLRPVVGAVLLAAVVPVTSGFAAGFPLPHLRLSEALIGAVGLTLVLFVRRDDAVPWQRLDWVLLAYGCAWALFGVYADVSLHQHLAIDQWGTVAGQLQFFLVYRGVRVGVRTPAERRVVLGAAVVAATVVALSGILQEVHAPGVVSILHKLTGGLTGGSAGATTSGSLTRVTGPFVNWAALAGYLLPVALVVVALVLARVAPWRPRWFVGAGIVVALGLVLTIEQSAILCLLVGAVVLVRRYDTDGRLTRWVVAGVVLVALAGSPLLVTRLVHEVAGSAGTGRVAWVPQTLSFRWSVWSHQYLPAVGARPLTGYGVVLPTSIHWAWPESQYISFLIEGGVGMLAVFVALAAAMLAATLAAVRSAEPTTRALGLALTIAVVAMVVMDATWPFLSNGGMPQILWALMAVTVPGALRPPRRAGAGWGLLRPGPASSATGGLRGVS